MEEGYSLRHVLVEALLTFKGEEVHTELNEIVGQLHDLIFYYENQSVSRSRNSALPNSFLDAVKQSAKVGIVSD